jgi:tetratricopeptide (TPR) repeat protein
MIIKDEANSLPHCLTSIAGLWDELVVVDTGSRDATVAIAQGFGARVETFPWRDDFAAARNFSLEQCHGDWILVLDADEAVDAADHPGLRAALAAPDLQGYTLWIRNYLRGGAFIGADGPPTANDGSYAEGARFSHHYSRRGLRLFRAQPGPVFQGRVHELADPYFEGRGLPVANLEAVIHHFGKTDMDRDLAKQAEYLRLAKLEAAARPGDRQCLYNIIQEGLRVEAWPDVLEAAAAYLEHAVRAPMLVWLGGGLALQGLGRFEESLDYFQGILRRRPDHAVALGARAESLWKLHRLVEAEQHFLQAMESDPGYTLPFLRMARMLEEGQNISAARSVLEAGLDQNPKDALLWEALVGLSARYRDPAVAGDAWAAIQAVPDGGRGIWHQIVIQALRAQGHGEDAGRVLALGLAAFPADPDLKRLAENSPLAPVGVDSATLDY